jgi:hypothetical protein
MSATQHAPKLEKILLGFSIFFQMFDFNLSSNYTLQINYIFMANLKIAFEAT